jgi:hypothetical protein
MIRGLYFLGWVLPGAGDERGALVAMEKESMDFYRQTGTAVVQCALGDAPAPNAVLKEMIDAFALEGPYQIAMAYAYRGEIDASFDWLMGPEIRASLKAY